MEEWGTSGVIQVDKSISFDGLIWKTLKHATQILTPVFVCMSINLR